MTTNKKGGVLFSLMCSDIAADGGLSADWFLEFLPPKTSHQPLHRPSLCTFCVNGTCMLCVRAHVYVCVGAMGMYGVVYMGCMGGGEICISPHELDYSHGLNQACEFNWIM